MNMTARRPGFSLLLYRLIGRSGPPLFPGWRFLLLGCIIYVVGGGIFLHALPVFFLPLKTDFGVSSATISLLYAAARLEGGFEGPLIGYLISRFGPRAVIIAGACMSGGGLFLLTLAPGFWSFFFIYIGVVSLGYNAGFYHPISTMMNSWFIRYRGVAFAWLGARWGRWRSSLRPTAIGPDPALRVENWGGDGGSHHIDGLFAGGLDTPLDA